MIKNTSIFLLMCINYIVYAQKNSISIYKPITNQSEIGLLLKLGNKDSIKYRLAFEGIRNSKKELTIYNNSSNNLSIYRQNELKSIVLHLGLQQTVFEWKKFHSYIGGMVGVGYKQTYDRENKKYTYDSPLSSPGSGILFLVESEKNNKTAYLLGELNGLLGINYSYSKRMSIGLEGQLSFGRYTSILKDRKYITLLDQDGNTYPDSPIDKSKDESINWGKEWSFFNNQRLSIIVSYSF